MKIYSMSACPLSTHLAVSFLNEKMIVYDARDDLSSLADDASSVVTEAQYIGNKFAETITDLATGHYKPKSKKRADAFKKVFWDDPKYNPPLNNTHICYEYDAHFKEESAYWHRGGKKFTNEPRLAKIGGGIFLLRSFLFIQINVSVPFLDMGPKKPEEFPHFFEKGTTVMKRKGKIRPYDQVFK